MARTKMQRNHHQPQLSDHQIRQRFRRQHRRWTPPEPNSGTHELTAADLATFRHTWVALFKLGIVRNGEWPPPSGWRDAVIGEPIHDHQLAFVQRIGRKGPQPRPVHKRETPSGFAHASTCLERRGRGSCTC